MSSDGIEVEAVVGAVPKSATAVVRGRLTVVHGVKCIDVRVFRHAGDGRLVATKQGITLTRSRAEDLRALVSDLCDAAKPTAQDHTRKENEL